MRLPDNGRYGYPIVRPSTLRAVLLTENTTTSSFKDAITAETLSYRSGYPPAGIASSPSGTAISVSSGTQTSSFRGGIWTPASTTDFYAYVGDFTAHVMARAVNNPSRAGADRGTVFLTNSFTTPLGYTGLSLYQFAYNNLSIRVLASGLSTQYIHDVVPLGEWCLYTVRKRNTVRDANGLPLNGSDVSSQSIVDVFVNGQLIYTRTDKNVNWNSATGNFCLGGTFYDDASGAAFCFDGDIDFGFTYAEALSDDAIAEDVRRVHQLRTHCRAGLKVTVEDQNGEYRDLTDLNGVDWVTSATITDEPDNPTMDASVTLVREQGNQSLATLVTNAELNLANPGDVTSYVAPFLEIGRGIEIYSARVPVGIDPDGRDWFSVFKGYIDEIKEGGESIQIECRDQAAELIDAYIEQELQYSDPETAFAVEGEMQAILDDNSSTYYSGSYAPLTLYTPVSPGWDVLGWIQRREPVMSALRTLAGQIGWDVRYKYDKTTGAWRLTFFQPERDSPRATTTLTKDDILDVTSLNRNILGIRNVVRVVYPSSETTTPTLPTYSGVSATNGWNNVDGEGNRMTAYVELSDAVAIARVGRRLFMEVAEASSSQIDTINEAFDFALSMLLDLREEDLAKSITIPLMPEMEINDLPKVMPIPELFTVSQRLAVKRLTHTFDPGGATTTVEMRGKPAVGQKRWLMLDTRSGGGKPAVIDPTQAISDLTTGTLLGNLKAFVEKTGLLNGEIFAFIKNSNFSTFSSGLSNPPDYWEGSNWGTTEVPTQLESQAGSWGIALSSDGGTIRQRNIPCPDNVPVVITVIWKRDSTAPVSIRTVLFRWTSGDVLQGLIQDFSQPTGVADGDWIVSKRYTTTSSFYKVVDFSVSNVYAGSGGLITVDSVSMKRAGYGCQVTISGSVGLTLNNWNTVSFNAEDLDLGDIQNAGTITIKETGWYDFEFTAAVSVAFGLGVTYQVASRVLVDGSIERTSITEKDFNSKLPGTLIVTSLAGSIRLEQNQTLQFQVFANNSNNSGMSLLEPSSTRGKCTYLSFRQRYAD